MMRWISRVVTGTFMPAWFLAGAIFLAGRYGVAGAERDPLAGVFLVPLGLPWNRLVDAAPESAWPWLILAAPAVNLLLLVGLCRLSARR